MAERTPVRLQLSRRKGFNLQELSRATNGLPAVVVRRPSKWGNPFNVKDAEEAGYRDGHGMAVYAFRCWLRGAPDWQRGDLRDARDFILKNLPELHGKNLACTCPPDKSCHADVLLELANPAPKNSEVGG